MKNIASHIDHRSMWAKIPTEHVIFILYFKLHYNKSHNELLNENEFVSLSFSLFFLRSTKKCGSVWMEFAGNFFLSFSYRLMKDRRTFEKLNNMNTVKPPNNRTSNSVRDFHSLDLFFFQFVSFIEVWKNRTNLNSLNVNQISIIEWSMINVHENFKGCSDGKKIR